MWKLAVSRGGHLVLTRRGTDEGSTVGIWDLSPGDCTVSEYIVKGLDTRFGGCTTCVPLASDGGTVTILSHLPLWAHRPRQTNEGDQRGGSIAKCTLAGLACVVTDMWSVHGLPFPDALFDKGQEWSILNLLHDAARHRLWVLLYRETPESKRGTAPLMAVLFSGFSMEATQSEKRSVGLASGE
jgi:hypothetical protein